MLSLKSKFIAVGVFLGILTPGAGTAAYLLNKSKDKPKDKEEDENNKHNLKPEEKNDQDAPKEPAIDVQPVVPEEPAIDVQPKVDVKPVDPVVPKDPVVIEKPAVTVKSTENIEKEYIDLLLNPNINAPENQLKITQLYEQLKTKNHSLIKNFELDAKIIQIANDKSEEKTKIIQEQLKLNQWSLEFGLIKKHYEQEIQTTIADCSVSEKETDLLLTFVCKNNSQKNKLKEILKLNIELDTKITEKAKEIDKVVNSSTALITKDKNSLKRLLKQKIENSEKDSKKSAKEQRSLTMAIKSNEFIEEFNQEKLAYEEKINGLIKEPATETPQLLEEISNSYDELNKKNTKFQAFITQESTKLEEQQRDEFKKAWNEKINSINEYFKTDINDKWISLKTKTPFGVIKNLGAYKNSPKTYFKISANFDKTRTSNNPGQKNVAIAWNHFGSSSHEWIVDLNPNYHETSTKIPQPNSIIIRFYQFKTGIDISKAKINENDLELINFAGLKNEQEFPNTFIVSLNGNNKLAEDITSLLIFKHDSKSTTTFEDKLLSFSNNFVDIEKINITKN